MTISNLDSSRMKYLQLKFSYLDLIHLFVKEAADLVGSVVCSYVTNVLLSPPFASEASK